MTTGIVQSDGRHMQPHDLDAEESLLGAMVVSPNAMPIATELVVEDDFYRDTHRIVFRTIRDMYGLGKEVDAVTLSAALEAQGVLERVGGKAFVHTLVEIVPAAANVRQYAEIVRETSVLRQLIKRRQRDRRARLRPPRRRPHAARHLRAEGLRHLAAPQLTPTSRP